ncbi:hypothetical protein ACF05T_26935 [Streptomyces lateritius]|uniref:Uncharacterized protein n=1 Tax=Streptomyces lateritius TaxID=67313 RepID=A0ABW6YIL7_9ACTN
MLGLNSLLAEVNNLQRVRGLQPQPPQNLRGQQGTTSFTFR